MNHTRKSALLVIAPLVIGSAFYWLARPNGGSYLAKLLTLLPNYGGFGKSIPLLLLSTLPSFLWGFSLCILLLLIWRPWGKWAMLACGGASVSASMFFELLQKWQVVTGTFDWLDVAATAFAAVLAGLFFKAFIVNT